MLVSSSTGEGEMPDNGDRFFRWIKKQKREELLPAFSKIHFTVLGLGDSNYTKYQNVPKTLDASFHELGANRFHRRGAADEATNLEEGVEPWIEEFWKALEQLFKELS